MALLLSLFLLRSGGQLFAHCDPAFTACPSFAASLRKELRQSGLDLDTAGVGVSLPPSTGHSFLKRRREAPAMLVADYGEEYTNRWERFEPPILEYANLLII